MLDSAEVTHFFDDSVARRPLLPDPATAGGWAKLAKYRLAADAIREAGATRVLDLGCNIGHLAALLGAPGNPAEEIVRPPPRPLVVGVDLSLPALRRAHELGLARRDAAPAAFAAASGLHLPFPDAAFDLVITLDVVEHVPDPARFLAEAHRVLRPGGRLLLMTPNPRGLASYAGYRLRRALRRLAGRPEADKDAFLTAAALARHAAAAGFPDPTPTFFLPRPFIVLHNRSLTPPLPASLTLRYQRLWVRLAGPGAERLPRPLRQFVTHTLLLQTEKTSNRKQKTGK